MMTPTRKSGRQPKPSAKLKEYLYENEIEKVKESTPRTSEKKSPQIVKGPVSKEAPKKKELQQTKTPVAKEAPKKKESPPTKTTGPRMLEKKSTTVHVKKVESPDTATPARKSGRTPKPSVKLQEYLCDERDKSNDSLLNKRTPRDSEKTKRGFKIKEEIEDEEETDGSDEDAELGSDKPTKKLIKKPTKENVSSKRLPGKMSTQELLRMKMQTSSNISSPRARVTNLTSISAKKEKNASRLTIRKGKIYTTTQVSSAKDRLHPKTALQEKSQTRRVVQPKDRVLSVKKRKREPESFPTANKKFIKTKDPSKLFERAKRSANETKASLKENAYRVEKKEIEKVLQVNKEVMTQLLNFGAEVAEAMACNNESIFSFSTKDNPLQSFKIDKQQDDFSDEEVVKIIKWFEEEEEQRRAYRKRILEALRASHETNMSLYTQMLKMLQSVTAC
ncbi:neurofilament heavy polypeptide-like isoform X2 [Macrobrachium rosenbergii]|uniref:neurofilament heavy polypeptide-like isoform X2 n=1 Tax=Macrobrachium rosenbergii TaxID=79674 RepID=UPI0034D446C6